MKIEISEDIGEEVIRKLSEFLDLIKKKLKEKENEKECSFTHSR